MKPGLQDSPIFTEGVLEAFEKTSKALKTAQTVFLTTHERTDGDDLGTVLALANYLESQGKQVRVEIQGGVPTQLGFLPGSETVKKNPDPQTSSDVLIVSGCSSIERTGVVDISKNAKLLINLDHHPDNKRYGDINIVDPGISSVAELTYHLFNHNTWPINTKIATCLITGIITDTGSFLHSNTELSTLRAASELMRKGARTAHVAKHAFQGKDVIGLQAWGKAMQNTWVDNTKHMACSVVTAEDIEELGNPPLSVFEGVVETINKIPEAKFALFLKQDGELIKGSLRSDPHKQDGGVDVGSLAKLFGGGGHRFAAGFAFPGQLKRINGKTVILENQKNRKPEPILD